MIKWILPGTIITLIAAAIAFVAYTQYTEQIVLPPRYNSNGAIYSNYRYIIKTIDFQFLRRDADIPTLWIAPRSQSDNSIQVRMVNQDARTLELAFQGWEPVETRPDFIEFIPPATTCSYLAIDININETGDAYTIIHQRGNGSDLWQFGATKGILCLSAADDSHDLVKLFKTN